METYQELRTRQQKEVDALPLGFAFSEKQFEEMKAKLGVKENSELYRLGNTGGFYRKIDADLIIGTFKRPGKMQLERNWQPNAAGCCVAQFRWKV